MKQWAVKGSELPVIRQKALQLTSDGFGTSRGLASKDVMGETRRLFVFVRDKIRYVMDTEGVELLHPADWILAQAAGDCDDKSILLAALLLSIGHRPRFKAVAFESDENGPVFSHVWVQDFVGGQWVDLETTEHLSVGQSVPLGNAIRTITLEAWR
jgi:hypothetical protein